MFDVLTYKDLSGDFRTAFFKELEEAISYVHRQIVIRNIDRASILNQEGEEVFNLGRPITEDELFDLP